jgi:hypothetical protein
VLITAAHFAILPLLLGTCGRSDLSVRVTSPAAANKLVIEAEIPGDIADRVQVSVDGERVDLDKATAGPGLHRVEWSVHYRGGFERRVGLTQLVGPFQDPAAPPCSVRLLVGQRLLIDGDRPGTVAQMAKQQIEKNMKDFEKWPIGAFERVEDLKLRWLRLQDEPHLAYKLRKARIRKPDKQHADVDALLIIELTMKFSRGEVPVFIAAAPELTGPTEVDIEIFAEATVDFDSRIYQWISDLFKGDRLARSTAQDEINYALEEALRAPPPIPLPGGRKLVFEYCTHRPVEVVTDKYLAIPLALRLEGVRPDIRPITLGSADRTGPATLDAPLALEFELDAINGVLYYLWRTGFLDQELRKAGIDRRFNEDPRVASLLTVRIGELKLALPPTVRLDPHAHHQFLLGAEATMMIRDAAKKTPARVYSTIGFDFAAHKGGKGVVADLELDDLQLTCEPEPGLLRPCYAILVDAVKNNADALHGELTRVFTSQFNRIVLNRSISGGDGMPELTIEGSTVRAIPAPPTGIIRVDLHGKLRTP